MKNEESYSQLVHTVKDLRDLGARGLSEFVEGSWRD
jgi:hypothetical protein